MKQYSKYSVKPKCPFAPQEHGRDVDRLLETFMLGAKNATLTKDKKATILFAGDVGGGKSTLAFHALQIVDPSPDVRRVSFNEQTRAKAMSLLDEAPVPVMLDDEFNVSSRDSMKDKNKDLIDLLFSIRGENWIFLACNPSVKAIDKTIIEEGLVNIFIFISVEQSRYLFFTRKGLLDLIKTHGSCSFYNLKTYGPYFAVYEGWFKKYDGPVWKEYLKLKSERMSEKKENYIRKYSQGDLMSMNAVAKQLGVSWATLRKAFRWGCRTKMLVEPRDYYKDVQGKAKFTEKGYDNVHYIVAEQLYLGE